MKPGATYRPSALSTEVAVALPRLPIATMRSPRMPTSARIHGLPVPSNTRPPRMRMSNRSDGAGVACACATDAPTSRAGQARTTSQRRACGRMRVTDAMRNVPRPVRQLRNGVVSHLTDLTGTADTRRASRFLDPAISEASVKSDSALLTCGHRFVGRELISARASRRTPRDDAPESERRARVPASPAPAASSARQPRDDRLGHVWRGRSGRGRLHQVTRKNARVERRVHRLLDDPRLALQ